MRKLKGQIHTGTGQDGMTITIEDVRSGKRLLEIEIPYKLVGAALHGSGAEVPIELIDAADLEVVGKKRETKKEYVWIPGQPVIAFDDDPKRRKEAADWRTLVENAIAAHEKGGWKGHIEAAFNGNNVRRDRKPPGVSLKADVNGNWYEIPFWRYV